MGIITDGLVGYWHYAQGVNGNTWQNIAPSTQGQYNGIINGGVTLVSDGMSFDGNSGSYVNIGAFPPLAGLSAFTFQILITAPVDTNTRNALSIYNDNNNRWQFGYNTGQKAQYSVVESGVSKSLSSTSVVTSDMLLTITSSPTGRKIYYGSSLSISDTVNTSVLAASINNLVIGCGFFSSPSYFFKGEIRAVRIYNRTLTQSEILNNYNVANSDIGIVVANNYTASLLDSVNSTDISSKYFAKDIIVDNMSSMDTFVKHNGLNINEEVRSLDNASKGIQYLKSDYILTADEKYIAIAKEVNDIVNTVDSFSSKLTKIVTLIDSIYPEESYSDASDYNRTISDSVILEDVIIKSLEKLQEDYVSTGDMEEYLYHKILVESIAPNDNLATILTKYRYIFDTVSITDAIVSEGTDKEKLIYITLSTAITRESDLYTEITTESGIATEITREVRLNVFL